MKKVLVIGASGQIGTELVLELRNRNAKNKYKLYSGGLELESFPELEQQKKEFEIKQDVNFN